MDGRTEGRVEGRQDRKGRLEGRFKEGWGKRGGEGLNKGWKE
jgi:hypothetical protein